MNKADIADIGVAVSGATDAAHNASDIVLTKGLSVIISVVLASRAIFKRMKNYTIYVVSITIRIVLGFLLIALIWKFDFSPFMIMVIGILNDVTIMTIAKDTVRPSPHPDSWKLDEIFATGVVYGTYMAVMAVVFFWTMRSTNFFSVGKKLSELIRDTSAQTSGGDSGRWQAELTQVAIELIAMFYYIYSVLDLQDPRFTGDMLRQLSSWRNSIWPDGSPSLVHK